MRQGKLNVTGGIAHTGERCDPMVEGQLVGFLECAQRRIEFARCQLDKRQCAIAITLYEQVASTLAQLDADF